MWRFTVRCTLVGISWYLRPIWWEACFMWTSWILRALLTLLFCLGLVCFLTTQKQDDSKVKQEKRVLGWITRLHVFLILCWMFSLLEVQSQHLQKPPMTLFMNINTTDGLKWKRFKPAFCLMTSRGQLLWLPKKVQLDVNSWENNPISHLIWRLSKHLSHMFMVSLASFRFYLI